jgi:hypothetical protein
MYPRITMRFIYRNALELRKNVLGTTFVLHFYLNILRKTMFPPINISRVKSDMTVNTHVGPFLLPDLTKIVKCRQILIKLPNMTFIKMC